MANLIISQRVVTLPAGVSTQLHARALDREYLAFQVIGAGNVNLGFNAAAVVDQGWAMDAAPAAGRQGGGLVFEGRVAPTNEIFAISAAGSTVVVLEG